jgi:hypothetical protein
MSLEMFKSLVTTAIVALAVAQALGMAQVRGYVRFLPLEKAQLRRYHRWGGVSALILVLIVAVICVCGEGYVLYSLRVRAHVVLGVLAILVLSLKVAITHRLRRLLRYNTALGVAAGALILGVFVTSALWYFVTVL